MQEVVSGASCLTHAALLLVVTTLTLSTLILLLCMPKSRSWSQSSLLLARERAQVRLSLTGRQ